MSGSGRMLVAGPINIDLLMQVDRFSGADDTVMSTAVSRALGGNAANAAVHARKLGASVALAGAVGADPDGDLALSCLRALSVDVSSVCRSRDRPTGTAVCVVRTVDGVRSLYLGEGANACWPDEILEGTPHFDLVVAFGLPFRGYRKLAEQYSGKIIFNPGTPILNGHFQEVSWFMKHCHTIVLNAVEAEAIAGKDAFRDAAACLRRKTGVEKVIVTCGEKGAYFFSPEAVFHQTAFDVVVRDTTGAGDGFLGGYACALLDGASEAKAVEWGCATAALSIAAIGASEGAPEVSEVEALIGARKGVLMA